MLGALTERRGLLDFRNTRNTTYHLVKDAARSVPAEARGALAQRRASWIRAAQGPQELLVFTDLECPFCAKLDEELATTEFTVLYVHYPLSIHPSAPGKHRVVECVSRSLGSTDANAVADHYFNHRESDELDGLAVVDSSLASGLHECIEGVGPLAREVDEILRADIALGVDLSIDSTPTFVVGTTLLTGAVDGPTLRQLWAEFGDSD